MTVLRQDLESAAADRRFGTGWISGVLALVLAVIGLGAVLCLRYPDVLTVPDARAHYNVGLIRLALHAVLIGAFGLATLNIVLRKQKVLGFVAIGGVLLATVLGGPNAQDRLNIGSDVYFGLDWFLLNLILMGIVFVPIERLLGQREQPIFRYEWREDLLYLIFVYFLSALVHSNLRLSFGPLEKFLVTPRFHHWHHGIEKEAIDVNFAVHFPVLDRAFGTYFLPEDGRWPNGYGIKKPVPKGMIGQFLHPFRRDRAAAPPGDDR